MKFVLSQLMLSHVLSSIVVVSITRKILDSFMPDGELLGLEEALGNKDGAVWVAGAAETLG